jgi:hypothetical protein
MDLQFLGRHSVSEPYIMIGNNPGIIERSTANPERQFQMIKGDHTVPINGA